MRINEHPGVLSCTRRSYFVTSAFSTCSRFSLVAYRDMETVHESGKSTGT